MPERPRERRASLDVDISESGGDWSELGDDSSPIYLAAEAVAVAPGVLASSATVSIALSFDDEIAKLNAAFRGKSTPTNVLSFPAGPGSPTGFLGDIVLAAETIAREAKAQGVSFVDHTQHLVVHGLLHLLGYGHETDADAVRMEALETHILAGLGVADPYDGELDSADSAKE
jgi:probable rRNA maturation factor